MALQDALAALETPGGPDSQRKRNLSTPLSEVIGRNLKVALANSTRQTAAALSASPQLKAAPQQGVGVDFHSYYRLDEASRMTSRLKSWMLFCFFATSQMVNPTLQHLSGPVG